MQYATSLFAQLAVERDVYASVRAGVDATVDLYIAALRRVHDDARCAKWRIHVHPVPPVLDITRGMVELFNTVLSERIAATKATMPRLRFLPFFNQLLLPVDGGTEGGALPPLQQLDPATTLMPASTRHFNVAEFGLDSTHMHPKYAALLAAGINE
jgi:hypothetical protein